MTTFKCFLKDENATVDFGKQLAQIISKQKQGIIAYLNGDLGAGKTTLTRGFVQAMGHNGKVKSPTYTLVEPYLLDDWQIFHFDLYRLSDPEELEYIGIRDYFGNNCCSFIEWPEKGAGMLVDADININLLYVGEQREIEIQAKSKRGESLLEQLK